jgi:hypothetical protein
MDNIERLKKANVIHCDLDKTLCIEDCWTPEECINATPNEKLIRLLYKLQYGTMWEGVGPKIIIVYTARRIDFAEETIRWCLKNNIFWPISFTKIPSDVYIDDKAINIDDLNNIMAV